MELVEEDVSFRESVLKVSNYLLDEMEVWQWAASLIIPASEYPMACRGSSSKAIQYASTN